MPLTWTACGTSQKGEIYVVGEVYGAPRLSLLSGVEVSDGAAEQVHRE
jgi:hypothetical protein